MILEVNELTKSYQTATHALTVLDRVSFSVEKGDAVAIVGPSGSGKTTLLGLCAGLDRATSGTVTLNDIPLDALNEDERADIRNRFVGFVFQNFQLIPTLTALENVMVPLELRGEKSVAKRAMEWLGKVGLADRHDHYPGHSLSNLPCAPGVDCQPGAYTQSGKGTMVFSGTTGTASLFPACFRSICYSYFNNNRTNSISLFQG